MDFINERILEKELKNRSGISKTLYKIYYYIKGIFLSLLSFFAGFITFISPLLLINSMNKLNYSYIDILIVIVSIVVTIYFYYKQLEKENEENNAKQNKTVSLLIMLANFDYSQLVNIHYIKTEYLYCSIILKNGFSFSIDLKDLFWINSDNDFFELDKYIGNINSDKEGIMKEFDYKYALSHLYYEKER